MKAYNDFEPAAFEIEECVGEVLKDWRKNAQRYSGVVAEIEGSTTFIRSGNRLLLTWTQHEGPAYQVGDQVEFAVDGQRAIRVRVIPAVEEIPA